MSESEFKELPLFTDGKWHKSPYDVIDVHIQNLTDDMILKTMVGAAPYLELVHKNFNTLSYAEIVFLNALKSDDGSS